MSELWTYDTWTSRLGEHHEATLDNLEVATRVLLTIPADGAMPMLLKSVENHATGQHIRTLNGVGPTWAKAAAVRWRTRAQRCETNLLGEDVYEAGETWYTEET